MNKIKLTVIVCLMMLCTAKTATAKAPEAYLSDFYDKIGLHKINNHSGSMLEVQTQSGQNNLLMKIISRGQNYRVEMAVRGQQALIIGDKNQAHVRVNDQTTHITDQQQIDQMIPLREIKASTFFRYTPGAVFTYRGQERHDGKMMEVIGCNDRDGLSRLYFDTYNGLLVWVNTMVKIPGEVLTVDVRFDNYMTFAGGEIQLPTLMTTTIAGQTTTNQILNYIQPYSTTNAMFQNIGR